MDKELLQQYLTDFGLKQDEINLLTPEQAINYMKFHHQKKYGISSILFADFSEEENKILSNTAKAAGLTVNSKISSNLTFICAADNADIKRIKKAQDYGAKLLSKSNFETLFNQSEYKLYDCTLIYDTSIPSELRIAKPLSNFDKNLEINSYSFDSDEKYTVNLYNMTCSCKDFEKKHRSQYVKGDLRRFCKHILNEYKTGFGLIGLSAFHRFIFENNQTLSKQFKYFNLEKLPSPVIVNFETKDDWWNIFIQNEKGIYKGYGYSPSEERFSYGEVPRGLTAPLRQKLKELKNQLNGISNVQTAQPKTSYGQQKKSSYTNSSSNKTTQSNKPQQPGGGCLTILIFPVAYIIYLLLS